MKTYSIFFFIVFRHYYITHIHTFNSHLFHTMFRRWFSDRRFSFGGTTRLRENISGLLNDINHAVSYIFENKFSVGKVRYRVSLLKTLKNT